MKKRLLSAFLCAAMLATMIPAAFASDLDGHWSKNFIEYLDDEGIINPSATTGKYEPERKVTRAEFMRYVNRAFHFTEKASISYSDVQSNSWYYDTVRIAEKYGYINGTGNGRMNPEGYVTREQAAVILGRLYKADPGNVKPANLSFKDKAKVATWSAGYVKAAVDKGIITGYKDNTFKPTKVITRAELAKILYYYLGTSLSTAGKAYTGSDLKSDTANVTISESCTLSDATIDGDLYLTEGLASDAVQLNDVYVKGTIIVAGGTVTMTNTMSDHIVVSSPMGRLLQVTARFPSTEVRSTAVLYEKKLTTPGYEGFADVKINGDKKVSLTLDADINHLELDTESTVSTTANASVYRMTASKPASVTGYGTIYQAEIKSSGVSFASSVRVSGYTIANGVTATAGGQTLTGSVTAAVSPESIAVDLNNLSALGKNVAVTVPNGLKIEKIESNGAVLAAGTVHLPDFQRGVQPHHIVDGRVECDSVDHSSVSFTSVYCLYLGLGQRLVRMAPLCRSAITAGQMRANLASSTRNQLSSARCTAVAFTVASSGSGVVKPASSATPLAPMNALVKLYCCRLLTAAAPTMASVWGRSSPPGKNTRQPFWASVRAWATPLVT